MGGLHVNLIKVKRIWGLILEGGWEVYICTHTYIYIYTHTHIFPSSLDFQTLFPEYLATSRTVLGAAVGEGGQCRSTDVV